MKSKPYIRIAALTSLLWGGLVMASGGHGGTISVNRSSMRPLTDRERQNAPVVVAYRGSSRRTYKSHPHQGSERRRGTETQGKEGEEVSDTPAISPRGHTRKHPLILVPAEDGRGYIVVGPVRRTPPDTSRAPNLRPAQVPPRNDENFVNTPPPLRAAQIAPRTTP